MLRKIYHSIVILTLLTVLLACTSHTDSTYSKITPLDDQDDSSGFSSGNSRSVLRVVSMQMNLGDTSTEESNSSGADTDSGYIEGPVKNPVTGSDGGYIPGPGDTDDMNGSDDSVSEEVIDVAYIKRDLKLKIKVKCASEQGTLVKYEDATNPILAISLKTETIDRLIKTVDLKEVPLIGQKHVRDFGFEFQQQEGESLDKAQIVFQMCDDLDGNGRCTDYENSHRFAEPKSYGAFSFPNNVVLTVRSCEEKPSAPAPPYYPPVVVVDPVYYPPVLVPPGAAPEGIIGGHFDVDTANEVYALGDGKTNGHVHEYDDKYLVNGVNFFDFLNDKLDNIQSLIPADKPFYLIVANAELSIGGALTVNGNTYNVLEYQISQDQRLQNNESLTVFRLGPAQAGERQLTALTMAFALDTFQTDGGLVATETGCVRKNEAGPNGEYRTGSLTVQAIAVDGFELTSLGVASANSELLWESTLFWHVKDTCAKSGKSKKGKK